MKKSHLTPAHSGEWLGYNIDLIKGIIKIPETKVALLLVLLGLVANKKALEAKKIASIVGKIISMGQ